MATSCDSHHQSAYHIWPELLQPPSSLLDLPAYVIFETTDSLLSSKESPQFTENRTKTLAQGEAYMHLLIHKAANDDVPLLLTLSFAITRALNSKI